MANLLTDLGEEFALETALEGASVKVALYNDSTDAIGDTDDVAALTTEPTAGNYTRQNGSLTLQKSGGDWQAVLAASVTFDVSGTNDTVDSWALIANFQADDTGDSQANDHLITTGALSQTYDLSYLDSLQVSNAGFKVT